MEYAPDSNITSVLLSIIGIILVVVIILAILKNVTSFPVIVWNTTNPNSTQSNNWFSITYQTRGEPAPNSLAAFFNKFSSSSNRTSSPSASSSAANKYQLGDVLNSTADLATNVLKGGLDITNGGIHLAGNLINKSIKGIMTIENIENLDSSINTSTTSSTLPSLDKSTSSIQNSANPNAPKWCYIGEFQGKRGCAEIANGDFCPGDTYDNYEKCSATTNMKTFLSSVSTRFSKNKIYTSP